MRQCFKCQEKFPDTESQCPLCGHTRSFTIAGTTRIGRKSVPPPSPLPSAPAQIAKPAAVAAVPAMAIPSALQDPATWSYNPNDLPVAPEDEEWHPSGMRWAGITMVGILFPPLAALSILGGETIFLLIIQWMAVLFGCFLIFELAWAEWLGGAFAMFSILKEVRGLLLSLAFGHWLGFLLGAMVVIGLGMALVMLRQGYSHPGTRKLVYPACGLVAGSLLLVFAGAVTVHQTSGEVPTPDPYAEHDRKTREAAKFMEESIHPPTAKPQDSGVGE